MLFCSKQKTAYNMRIIDWSTDVCSSVLPIERVFVQLPNRLRDRRTMVVDQQRIAIGIVLTRKSGEMDFTDTAQRQRVDGGLWIAIEIGRASCRERVCQYV